MIMQGENVIKWIEQGDPIRSDWINIADDRIYVARNVSDDQGAIIGYLLILYISTD